LKILCAFLMTVVFQAIPWLVFAGEGLDVPDSLDKKVPLEGLAGIRLFFAKTYNENLWLYALYCTILMAVLGVGIAFFTDIILKAMGMEVEKIEHKE
jgi:hypothetical protein